MSKLVIVGVAAALIAYFAISAIGGYCHHTIAALFAHREAAFVAIPAIYLAIVVTHLRKLLLAIAAHAGDLLAVGRAIVAICIVAIVASLPCFLHTIAALSPAIGHTDACCAIIGEHTLG